MNELSRRIRAGARRKMRNIILADGENEQVIEAMKTVVYESFARPILLGRREVIEYLADRAGLETDTIYAADPSRDRRAGEYADMLMKLCADEDMSREKARSLAAEPMNFGLLMLKAGAADGMVCGCGQPSADVIGSALRIVGAEHGRRAVSSSYLMKMRDGRVFSFSDCAAAPEPDSAQTAETAALSARAFEELTGEGARVAMLSYSTYGANAGAINKKMHEAALMADRDHPGLFVSGSFQLDTVLDERVANLRMGGEGMCNANVLIFPDVSSAVVSRRIVQRLTRARVIGPIIKGLARPVNDIPDGANASDIADIVAVTAVQAQNAL